MAEDCEFGNMKNQIGTPGGSDVVRKEMNSLFA